MDAKHRWWEGCFAPAGWAVRIGLVAPHSGAARLAEPLLLEVLAAVGARVHRADSVPATMALLENRSCDLYLIDVDLGAEEVLRLLRAAARLGDPAAVLLADRDDQELIARALEAGAVDCLFRGSLDAELLLRALHGAIRRVEDRKRLAEAEERHASLFTRNLAGSFRLSAGGDLLDCNRAFARIFGFADREAVLQAAPDLLAPLVAAAGERPPLLSGQPIDALIADRLERLVSVRVRLVERLSEQLSTVDGTLVEIPAARHSGSVAVLLAAISSPALLVDEEGRVEVANAAAGRLFGRPAESLRGELCPALVGGLRDASGRAQAWPRALSGEGSRAGLETFTAAGGSVGPLELELRRHDALDRAGGALLLLEPRDRVAPTRNLTTSQRFEALGHLVSGVAHDFHNILAAVRGYADLLRSAAGTDARLAKMASDLAGAASRGQELTGQLLRYSREGGAARPADDVPRILRNLSGMLERLLGGGIELELAIDDRPFSARIDAAELEQIVTNLVLNARDAMPRGGKLLLASEEIRVDPAPATPGGAVRDGSYLRLRVEDTGIGMDETTLRRMFEPFFTTKEPGRGTGLGLAVVRQILDRRRGWIDVRSAPDQGTRVEVWLPAVANEARTDPA